MGRTIATLVRELARLLAQSSTASTLSNRVKRLIVTLGSLIPAAIACNAGKLRFNMFTGGRNHFKKRTGSLSTQDNAATGKLNTLAQIALLT
jgi:hypothetical protein